MNVYHSFSNVQSMLSGRPILLLLFQLSLVYAQDDVVFDKCDKISVHEQANQSIYILQPLGCDFVKNSRGIGTPRQPFKPGVQVLSPGRSPCAAQEQLSNMTEEEAYINRPEQRVFLNYTHGGDQKQIHVRCGEYLTVPAEKLRFYGTYKGEPQLRCSIFYLPRFTNKYGQLPRRIYRNYVSRDILIYPSICLFVVCFACAFLYIYRWLRHRDSFHSVLSTYSTDEQMSDSFLVSTESESNTVSRAASSNHSLNSAQTDDLSSHQTSSTTSRIVKRKRGIKSKIQKMKGKSQTVVVTEIPQQSSLGCMKSCRETDMSVVHSSQANDSMKTAISPQSENNMPSADSPRTPDYKSRTKSPHSTFTTKSKEERKKTTEEDPEKIALIPEKSHTY